jgi:replicative DNA helicase
MIARDDENILFRNETETHFTLAVLDCVLCEHRGWLSEVLAWFDTGFMADAFFRGVVEALIELHKSELPITSLEVARRLQQQKQAAGASLEWVTQLGQRCTAQAGHISYYARRVYDEYRKRAASLDAHATANDLEVSAAPDEQLAELGVLPDKYAAPQMDRCKEVREAIDEVIAEMETGARSGLDLGIGSVDVVLAGIADTSHVVIAAETSCGKSVLLAQVAAKVAAEDHKGVAFFSLEMNAKEMTKRWACLLSASSADDVSQRRQLLDGFANVRHLTDNERLLHLFCGTQTIDAIEHQATAVAASMPLGAVFVDYLQIVHGDNRAKTREEEVAGVSRRLKQLAGKLRVPVFAACQVNRAGSGAPTLKHLRESGAIEQNADVVLILDPESRPKRNQQQRSVDMTIAIAKNRNGPTDTIQHLIWDGHLYRIRESEAVDMDNYEPAFEGYSG